MSAATLSISRGAGCGRPAENGCNLIIKRVFRRDFNWATAWHELMLNSTEFSIAYPFTEDPQGRFSAAHRSGAQGTASAGAAQSYGRIYMRQLWCRPDTCGRRKRLSSRGPLQLLRLVQFDRRLTPFNPYAATG